MNLNGAIVDFICLGGAVILTGLAMGLVLLLTEDRRGRIFMQEIPAKFRHLVATPEHPASDWVKPMHRATPAARQMLEHIGGLGHLLPRVSPWRAAMLARNLAARAARARKLPAEVAGAVHEDPVSQQEGSHEGGTVPERAEVRRVPGQAVHPGLPLPRLLGPEGGMAHDSQQAQAPARSGILTPAAAGSDLPSLPPPLPDLPPDGLDASCTYGEWQRWPGDDTLTSMRAIKAEVT